MSFTDILKKFWFVIVVGIFFTSIAIYVAWDRNKDLISAKSVDGKDVIFTLNNKNYTADAYYDELFSKTAGDGSATYGVQLSFSLIERSVVRQSTKVTDEIEKQANETYTTTRDNLKNQYGKNYDSYVASELRKLGYEGSSDLESLFLDQLLAREFYLDYIKKHPELFDEIYNTESPRVLSQILVKIKDKDNITDDEKKHMAQVDDALKTTDFGDVAKKYSDDTDSAADKGNLGIQLKSGTLAQQIKDAAWTLNTGEVSDWIQSDNGYHRIKVGTTDKEEMQTSKDLQDSYMSVVMGHFPNLSKEIVWNRAQELKIEINDEKLKTDLMKYVGVEK